MEDDEDSEAAEGENAPEDGRNREEDRSDLELSLGWTERGVFGDAQRLKIRT